MPRISKKLQETAETKPEVTEVTVFDGRKPVRTYSLEQHGEHFAQLAKQFATKYGYNS